jgi:hypothetical protein
MKCLVCGTESPAKYDWTGWNNSPIEQRDWRIVCWHEKGDDANVIVVHEANTCRDVLRARLDALGAPSIDSKTLDRWATDLERRNYTRARDTLAEEIRRAWLEALHQEARTVGAIASLFPAPR